MTTRQELQNEFIDLRNAQIKRPPANNTRLRNLYYDFLNDTQTLAAMKTDEQLKQAIEKMKAE